MSQIALTNLNPAREETRRVMTLCNACRYCEGYCPVFPAMTEHRTFSNASVDYLANLCHNCTACYHACQYKPPHDFAINVPTAMTELRNATYTAHVWPSRLASVYQSHPWLTLLTTGIVLAAVLLGVSSAHLNLQFKTTNPGAFYEVIDHVTMVAGAGLSFGYAAIILFIATWKYCRSINLGARGLLSPENWRHALGASARLTHLGGAHGQGCNTEDDQFSNQRRIYHHFTMWGFLLCFAATCCATIYQYGFDLSAPYPVLSLPVLLGIIGGLGLLIGPAGLMWLKIHSHTQAIGKQTRRADYVLLALLFVVSLSGLILLALRNTEAMPVLLAIHLAFVLTFFLLMPYSKFIHGFFRLAALLRYADEQRAKSQ